MHRISCVVLLITSGCLLAATPARGDERILSYDSRIEVLSDGSMEVTETIRVRAERKQIEHGIYRDFPTRYKTGYVFYKNVPFEVLEVIRDDAPEEYHTEARSNGTRVIIGDQNRTLLAGEYNYTIRYRTDRQLGFFDDHAELYWNVTGSGWEFPIDRATATVVLPRQIAEKDISLEAYTGEQGSTERAVDSRLNERGEPVFTTTLPLGEHEGLTIVVEFPKGIVTPPTADERMADLLSGSAGLLVGLAGTLAVLVYYLVAWMLVGRDPPAAMVFPQFEPPGQVSAPGIRFIRNMGYDDACATAAIYSLAVKGHLEINEADDTFTLVETSSADHGLSGPEKTLKRKLFNESATVELRRGNHRRIGKAISAFRNKLALDYEKTYFVRNRKWLVPGILLTLATLVATGLCSSSGEELAVTLFMMVWLSGWTVGVTVLLIAVTAAWQQAFSGSSAGGVAGAVFITLFSLPFVAGEIFGLGILISVGSVWVAVAGFLLVPINMLFYHLLKRPTLAGRQLLDEIEGFKLGMLPDDDRGNYRQDERLFERLLPYAVALDIESKWSERFAGALAASTVVAAAHVPSWYHGNRLHEHGSNNFHGALANSLGSAISSSSTAPGSSSGGGGGGSSGGGGGGGGGGGW